MHDLEWYLQSDGVRSGPYSARQVVDMYDRGMLSSSVLVTTARMGDEWILITELVEAFRELQPPKSADFAAPPRPIEQLEASKFITLQPKSEQSDGDATDSLFQAIQSHKEKKKARPTEGGTSTGIPTGIVSYGEIARPEPFIPPGVYALGIIVILGGLAWHTSQRLLHSPSQTAATSTNDAAKSESAAAPGAAAPAVYHKNPPPGSFGGNLMGTPNRDPVNSAPPVRNRFSGGAVRNEEPPQENQYDANDSRSNTGDDYNDGPSDNEDPDNPPNDDAAARENPQDQSSSEEGLEYDESQDIDPGSNAPRVRRGKKRRSAEPSVY